MSLTNLFSPYCVGSMLYNIVPLYVQNKVNASVLLPPKRQATSICKLSKFTDVSYVSLTQKA